MVESEICANCKKRLDEHARDLPEQEHKESLELTTDFGHQRIEETNEEYAVSIYTCRDCKMKWTYIRNWRRGKYGSVLASLRATLG